MRLARLYALTLALLLLSTSRATAQQPLATLEHHVIGARLEPSPPELFIPKNIPGSLAVNITTLDGTRRRELEHLREGTHVEAVLRGPAFPAFRLLGFPDEPLMLPPIALPGEYQIDDLRLVNTETNEVLLMATPSRVAVHVFPEVLVSRVESRPLTLDEIRQRGIVIDADSFSAVEFEAAFVIEGQTLPVRFPVVTPKFKQSTDLIPSAELEARLVQAEEINRNLTRSLTLPRELDLPGLHIQLEGFNFQHAGGYATEEENIVPPIPGLVVVPGHIGFLNRFFSVQVFAANASPRGSSISVHSLAAELVLPQGSNPQDPTDDPLEFPRVGPDQKITSRVPLATPGADGEPGTADDQGRIMPGQTAQGELLLEGKREGLHIFDVKLSGILDGFAHGEVPIEGRAAGSVMVRNPRFSIAFSHPHTIRVHEPYTAALTVMNTSDEPAELVSVTLRRASLSGTRFESEQQAETIELGTLQPGEAKTAEYPLVALQTGAVTFTNLTGEAITGRIDLTLAVDERGVALDAHAIGYPDWVDALPETLRRAADRVLGQALCVSTAAILPPGVRTIAPNIVEQRVIELAEAGQRLRYGDTPERVYLDLLLDFHGGRQTSAGFEQILRETNAGRALEQELIAGLAPDWIGEDLAGRGEVWTIATSDQPSIAIELGSDTRHHSIALERQTITEDILFRVPPETSGHITWASFDGRGRGRKIELDVSPQPTETCLHYFPLLDATALQIDPGCQNTSTGELTATETTILEVPPTLISVQQDLRVIAGRPDRFCSGPSDSNNVPYGNYGTLIAALFSKPMPASSIERSGAFELDDGVRATGVRIQPGGRVALINLRNGIGMFEERRLHFTGITDARNHPLTSSVATITRTADRGVSINGRVIGTDGAPAAFVPVTLTMHDELATPHGCVPVDVRVSQVRTDEDGRFTLDFVMGGLRLGYTLATTDTRRFDDDAVNFLLEASPEGELDPLEIERLATQPGAVAAFTAMFGAGDLHGSIAVAEGVDRATFHDAVHLTSPRLGTTLPVALRFRGRGTVFGTVYASDGFTPRADAAVNLFPDQGSRELGRGVRAGGNGEFVFAGVPLGAFSIDARTGDGLYRIVADRLDDPGEQKQIDIVLSAAAVPKGTLEGTVHEADGHTPHAGATVGVRDNLGNVQAVVIAGADGFFSASSIVAGPTSIDAISADGKRVGRRGGIAVQANSTTYASVMLPGTAEVVGRVEFANGSFAPYALVAGGEAIVTADAGGNFHLTGVPVGLSKISAGLLQNGIARFGGTQVEVLPGPGVTASAIIRLESRGGITGTVFDGEGDFVANEAVALPLGQGFYWTNTDDAGIYRFDNLPLGRYVVSAPAPLAVDTNGAIAAIESGDEAELAAALGEVFSLYTSGFNTDYNPGSYGFTRTSIDYDGHVVQNADIRYLPEGTVSGDVRNELDIPISARVILLGLVPQSDGAPGFGRVAEVMSDPSTGTFSFSGVRAGRYTVSASSPFYPTAVSASGELTLNALHASGVALRFGATETHGRLIGVVTRDGAPAGAGVRVRLSYTNYQAHTDLNSIFETSELPAGNYTIELLDPPSGRVGAGSALITPGNVTRVELPLFAATGALSVTVLQGNGTPAAAAEIELRRVSPPARDVTLTANEQGVASITNLIEGRYAVTACWEGETSFLCTSNAIDVPASPPVALTINLRGTGTISGVFVEADGTTPVGFGQIAIGEVAYAVSDAAGAFSAGGIPLGVHRLVGRNPVSGRAASANVHVAQVDQNVQVTLREDPLGEVIGHVIGSDGASIVPGAYVTITPSSALFPAITVTADPAGAFRLPGVPPGSFLLSAVDPFDTSSRGTANGQMPANAGTVELDIALAPRANLDVYVNGEATVTIGGRSIDTDPLGLARFTGLPLGQYEIAARARTPGQTRSTALAPVSITQPGEAPPVLLTLSGVGSVAVLLLDGSSAVPNAEVAIEMVDGLRAHHTDSALTGADGRFVFHNVALGSIRARGRSGARGAAENGTIEAAGQEISLTLRLGQASTVRGRLVRANGFTIVPNNELVLTYLGGAATTRTSTSGEFLFSGVPLGPIGLRGVVPRYDGVVFRERTIALGETAIDFGDVALDEEPPVVLDVVPANGATNVSVNAPMFVTFSEMMSENFEDPQAIYLTDGITHVPLLISWPASDTLMLTATSTLASEVAYTLVIAAQGGPVDLAGRSLPAPLVASFTTRDGIAPIPVFTPSDGAEQVDVSAVVRVSFSEPVVPESVVLTLSGPTGPVAGTISAVLNQQVIVFTPNNFLAPNTEYSATLSAAEDRASNPAVVGLETHVFRTIDTEGPRVVNLILLNPPIAGSTVLIEAELFAEEEGAQIELTADHASYAWSQPGSAFVLYTLPVADEVRLYARAIDRFGNPGPYYDELVDLEDNTPAEISIAQVAPSGGVLRSGEAFTFQISAIDDSAVVRVAASSSGAVTTARQESSSSPLMFTGLVSSEIGPGQFVSINAEAEDNSGAIAARSILVEVIDGAAPELVVLGPNVSVGTGTIAEFTVHAEDAFGVSELVFIVSGAVSFQSSVTFAPTRTIADETFELVVPADLPLEAPIHVQVVAFDQAGNADEDPRTLTVFDATPPMVESIAPENGATEIATNTIVTVTFSEPMEEIDEGAFYLESAGVPIGASVSHVAGETVAVLTPAQALELGTIYEVYLTDAIQDMHGNMLEPMMTVFETTESAGTNRTPALGYTLSQNRGLRFATGLSSRFSLPVSTQIAAPVTIDFWATLTPFNGPEDAVILDGATNHAMRVELDADTGLFVFGLNNVLYPSTDPPSSAAWHHFALVYDGARFRAYVDGLNVVDAAQSGAINYGSEMLQFTRFAGAIDEVRVWNTARTAQAIRETMHVPITAAEPGLLACWPLNVTGPSVIVDITGQHTANVSNLQSFLAAPPMLSIDTPAMTGAEHNLELIALDLDTQPLSIVIDTLPQHGRLYTSGTEITTAGFEHAGTPWSLTYVFDEGYFGPDQFTAHATDQIANSRTLLIELEPPPLRTWIGADAAWSTAANWSPAGVPTAGDAVLIRAGGNVVLETLTEVSMLTLEPGATLELTLPAALIVNSRVQNQGTISGAGQLRVINSALAGTFSNLSLRNVVLSGALNASGNVSIEPTGRLDVGPHAAFIAGDFSAQNMNGGAGLIMDDPASIVTIGGDATFSCTLSSNTLSAGELRIGGTLGSSASVNAICFDALETHRTVFGGASSSITTIDRGFATLEVISGANLALSSPPGTRPISRLVVRGTMTAFGVACEELIVPAGGWLGSDWIAATESCDIQGTIVTSSLSCPAP